MYSMAAAAAAAAEADFEVGCHSFGEGIVLNSNSIIMPHTSQRTQRTRSGRSHDDDDEERRERTNERADSKAVAHLLRALFCSLYKGTAARRLLRDAVEHCNYCACEMTRGVSR